MGQLVYHRVILDVSTFNFQEEIENQERGVAQEKVMLHLYIRSAIFGSQKGVFP